jgi:hypothetical protein
MVPSVPELARSCLSLRGERERKGIPVDITAMQRRIK